MVFSSSQGRTSAFARRDFIFAILLSSIILSSGADMNFTEVCANKRFCANIRLRRELWDATALKIFLSPKGWNVFYNGCRKLFLHWHHTWKAKNNISTPNSKYLLHFLQIRLWPKISKLPPTCSCFQLWASGFELSAELSFRLWASNGWVSPLAIDASRTYGLVVLLSFWGWPVT